MQEVLSRFMRIKRAEIGEPTRYPQSCGDLWATAWAADNSLYCVSDDTLGFDQACESNLAIHRITGDEPPHLQGKTLNAMPQFGKLAEFSSVDNGMWKAMGLLCLEGVLYLAVSRHAHQRESPFLIQETWDASIIKSTDGGKTWSAMPQLGHAMFPGHTFSTPFFVQYGQDGQGEADGAGAFVYAVSSNGVWNNGSSMVLGRVRRARIGRLEAQDWEFVHEFDAQGQPVWRARHDTARYIFRNPGRTSMTGIHYIAPLGLYIMPQWYYPRLVDYRRSWSRTRLEFYQAPTPWGPWSLFHRQDFSPQAWYNPSFPAKFISKDGRHLWMFVAGNFTDYERGAALDGYYGLFMLPLTLEVEDGGLPSLTIPYHAASTSRPLSPSQ